MERVKDNILLLHCIIVMKDQLIDHRHHRINYGRAFACACACVYVYVCVRDFACATVFLFLTIPPYCHSAIAFLSDSICARTCVSACLRAKGFCYRLSAGLRYRVDFSCAHGCVFCVRMRMCLFVCEKDPGMFPIYADIISDCIETFLRFVFCFVFFLENE